MCYLLNRALLTGPIWPGAHWLHCILYDRTTGRQDDRTTGRQDDRTTGRQGGRAQSALAVHAFLVNWLATAQKLRRFPRSVATDIDSLLHLGRQKGLASNLQQRLESLWQSCTESVAQQSDLFRLTYAIEHLKSLGWVNAVVADAEWQSQALQAEYAGTDALLVRKSELVRQFAEDGRLTGDIAFRVVGDSRVVVDVLSAGDLTVRFMNSMVAGVY